MLEKVDETIDRPGVPKFGVGVPFPGRMMIVRVPCGPRLGRRDRPDDHAGPLRDGGGYLPPPSIAYLLATDWLLRMIRRRCPPGSAG